MKTFTSVAAGFLAASLTLAGCGDSGAGAASPSLSTCKNIAAPFVVYPADGARVKPGGLKVILDSAKNPSIAWGDILFLSSTGAIVSGGPYRQAGLDEYVVDAPAITPQTTFTLIVRSRACGITENLGTFTTQ